MASCAAAPAFSAEDHTTDLLHPQHWAAPAVYSFLLDILGLRQQQAVTPLAWGPGHAADAEYAATAAGLRTSRCNISAVMQRQRGPGSIQPQAGQGHAPWACMEAWGVLFFCCLHPLWVCAAPCKLF